MSDLDLVLDADPSSVAPARAAFRHLLSPQLIPDDVDSGSVVVSELLTNAQRVTRNGRVLLRVTLARVVLRIEVIDTAESRPVRPVEVASDAETGRGLFLVEALSQRWGSYGHQLGNCVWAELLVQLIPPQAGNGRRVRLQPAG